MIQARYYLTVLLALGLSLNASADRTVSIVVDSSANAMSGSLKLANPSPVTVTFGLACYSNTGAQVISSSGKTLASNNLVMIGSGNTAAMSSPCADGSTPTWLGNWTLPGSNSQTTANPNSMIAGTVYACPSNGVSYANRESACGITMHACTMNELNYVQSAPYNSGTTTKTYWMGASTTGAFEYTTDSFQTIDSTSTSGTVPLVTSYPQGDPNLASSYANQCRFARTDSPPAAPMYAQLSSCAPINPTGVTASGTICCDYQPTFTNGGMCKVTIESSTPASGYLQSPSFKGGAPF